MEEPDCLNTSPATTAGCSKRPHLFEISANSSSVRVMNSFFVFRASAGMGGRPPRVGVPVKSSLGGSRHVDVVRGVSPPLLSLPQLQRFPTASSTVSLHSSRTSQERGSNPSNSPTIPSI